MALMLARTAKKMGFTVVVYCSDESNPVLAEADVKWSVSWNEKQSFKIFRHNGVT